MRFVPTTATRFNSCPVGRIRNTRGRWLTVHYPDSAKMDALKHLVANIPDWLKRLEELNGQVAKRQADLARQAEPKQSDSMSPKPTQENSLPNQRWPRLSPPQLWLVSDPAPDGSAPVRSCRGRHAQVPHPQFVVYYDSYVQLFFEELVKFVSASRGMMRKAWLPRWHRSNASEMEPDESDEEAEESLLLMAQAAFRRSVHGRCARGTLAPGPQGYLGRS
ncbi:hypothetical protein B0T14DRAFT_129863 [Immersiella caudata]|uniref:Uncharacterized protein n=1 Tax=Immersiella caudata TaxID=314043 RepID=A0AA39X4I8_9PEZI|nr:hypothetical protein B0T14DRAFT_129863 [Immersiella caudata]